MKVIILAGGYGTRLAEFTEEIPKPMVPINGKPILFHLMEYYASFGHNDFYIALGYKGDIIKKYFYLYNSINNDFQIDLKSGVIRNYSESPVDWKVSLVDTGGNTMTGGRVKRLKPFIGEERCLLTYGDGLSNININDLIEFHKTHGKMVTVSAVRPIARFGEIEVNNDCKVKSFKEKPHIDQGWINGGFFVVEPEFFQFIDNDDTVLEKAPLEQVARKGELMAFKHKGFWQCMDTKRDKEYLESLFHGDSNPLK